MRAPNRLSNLRSHTAVLAAAAGIGLVLAAGSAHAQGASGSSAMSSGSSSSSLSQTDQQYFQKDAQGSVYDLTLAQLGILRGATPRVRSYARMVATDHARLNIMMLEFANREGMHDLPLTLSSDDNTRLQRLMGLSGAEFDRAFAEEEVRINSQDVSDAEKELQATNAPGVRRIVQEFRQTESKHLAGARELQGR